MFAHTNASPDGFLHPALAGLHVRTGNLHGELLSVHKINQAYPGLPTVQGAVSVSRKSPKRLSTPTGRRRNRLNSGTPAAPASGLDLPVSPRSGRSQWAPGSAGTSRSLVDRAPQKPARRPFWWSHKAWVPAVTLSYRIFRGLPCICGLNMDPRRAVVKESLGNIRTIRTIMLDRGSPFRRLIESPSRVQRTYP